MSALDRNALDSALVDLAAASTALERSARPNLKDVEEARDRAKKAHGILDAAHKLMSVGIYVVATAPAMPGTPLPFDGPGPVAEEPVAPSPAELLRSWEGWSEEEREEQFLAQLAQIKEICPDADTQQLENLLDKLETAGLEGGVLALKDWKKAEKAWRAAWKQDPKDTFGRLSFAAYHREPISWGIPTDEEMAASEFVDPLAEEGGEA